MNYFEKARPAIQTEHFVCGSYQKAVSENYFTALNPADQKPVAAFALGEAVDMKTAIDHARRAFDKGRWPKMSPKERGEILQNFARLIKKKAKFLGIVESLTVGKLLDDCINHDVARAAENIEFFAKEMERLPNEAFSSKAKFLGKSIRIESLVKREPVGVAGLIIPWNSPFMLASWKIGPALAAGNTCVVKPSPWASLSVLQLGAIAHEAGLPPGVLNIIPGGVKAGEELVANSGVNRISFTGSVETGKLIQKLNAQSRLAPPSLELGGKAASIVFKDADLDFTVKGVARGIFRSQGQSCVAGSRLLIEKSIYKEFVNQLAKYTESLRIGNQLDPKTDLGPLITREHLERVVNYISSGLQEGASLLTGGEKPQAPCLKNGNYLEPTIFAGVNTSMRIWKEEIFGPVLVIMAFENEDEAIQLANCTNFGLSANIWTQNLAQAIRVANAIDTGMVWINSHFIRDLRAPFGGRKESGSGSEGGRYSLEFYTQPKTICIPYWSAK